MDAVDTGQVGIRGVPNSASARARPGSSTAAIWHIRGGACRIGAIAGQGVNCTWGGVNGVIKSIISARANSEPRTATQWRSLGGACGIGVDRTV